MRHAARKIEPPTRPRPVRKRVLASLFVSLAIMSTDFVVPGESPAFQAVITAVRGRLPAQAIAERIDREITRRLEKEGVKASPLRRLRVHPPRLP
jgi:hypothetical protein